MAWVKTEFWGYFFQTIRKAVLLTEPKKKIVRPNNRWLLSVRPPIGPTKHSNIEFMHW